jgi:hypothetical protein
VRRTTLSSPSSSRSLPRRCAGSHTTARRWSRRSRPRRRRTLRRRRTRQ